jgi:NAD(P)-dependent dehydrogenase (short-subunit alcohol dehydrogenase family)
MTSISAGVFITGAAGGIGSATVRRLADAGIPVFAGYHTSTAEVPTGPLVTPVQVDVTDPASVALAARAVSEEVGDQGLRAVINNAGVIVQGPIELLPPESLRRQFDINTLGPAFVTQSFLPLLRTARGRVINISAPTARVPIPFLAPIGASKAALASWSAALRGELAAWGMPVVLIEPDGTRTAIFANAERQAETDLARADPARAGLYDEQLRAIAAAGASQRLGEADVVARVILKAVTASKPRRRYLAGPGTRLFAFLSHLPTGMRDAMVMRAMGLHKIPAAG